MNSHNFTLAGAQLEARGSGALWWPEKRTLVVSDMHLGKAERIARTGGAMLPPYDTSETLSRLDAEVSALLPKVIICLGDSFDDIAASRALERDTTDWLSRLMAGRSWVWIEGNHDPGPLELGGTHLAELLMPPLVFRHIAKEHASGEVSGHYHPKATIRAKGRSITKPCFLYDSDRLILPAFGAYTGGLRCGSPELRRLMRPEAIAVLTGPIGAAIPMPG